MAEPFKVDYEAAKASLASAYTEAERALADGAPPDVPTEVSKQLSILFKSQTQAYREVLLGCVLVRLQSPRVNIRKPYAKQGSDAFNGRTLDEKVINPFLQEKKIPSSRGPYLSVFRRSVQFEPTTRDGLRDKDGFDALLEALGSVERYSTQALRGLLTYLLYEFLTLREASTVSLNRLQRLSLDQFDTLVVGLLQRKSGGRFPVLLVVALFEAIKSFFQLDWEIEHQGINVADAASGSGGDVTIRRQGRVVFAAEVTERNVDQARVTATFNTKIAPNGIEDYLFLIDSDVNDRARAQARQYFAQGHSVNFLQIRDWVRHVLGTMGTQGRAYFNEALLRELQADGVPQSMRVAWNEGIASLTIAD